MNYNFNIVNVVERNKDNPETFYIPAKEKILDIKIGDCVKIIITPNDTEVPERMWVVVDEIKKSNDEIFYRGSLDNDSKDSTILQSGLKIDFNSKHIIDIE